MPMLHRTPCRSQALTDRYQSSRGYLRQYVEDVTPGEAVSAGPAISVRHNSSNIESTMSIEARIERL
jgi:hypothetical protein